MFDTEHNSIRGGEDMTMTRTLEVNRDSEESDPLTHLDDILEIMVTVDKRPGNTVNLILRERTLPETWKSTETLPEEVLLFKCFIGLLVYWFNDKCNDPLTYLDSVLEIMVTGNRRARNTLNLISITF